MTLSSRDCAEIRAALASKGTGIAYGTVARWLTNADFVPPKKPSGSHRTWRHPSGIRAQTVDKGRGEMLPVYVKRAARAIIAVGGCK